MNMRTYLCNIIENKHKINKQGREQNNNNQLLEDTEQNNNNQLLEDTEQNNNNQLLEDTEQNNNNNQLLEDTEQNNNNQLLEDTEQNNNNQLLEDTNVGTKSCPLVWDHREVALHCVAESLPIQFRVYNRGQYPSSRLLNFIVVWIPKQPVLPAEDCFDLLYGYYSCE